jgi:hypothetical protein
LVIAIRMLLKSPLLALCGGHNAAHAIRYFLMVAFGGAVWPLTFKFWAGLAKRKVPKKPHNERMNEASAAHFFLRGAWLLLEALPPNLRSSNTSLKNFFTLTMIFRDTKSKFFRLTIFSGKVGLFGPHYFRNLSKQCSPLPNKVRLSCFSLKKSKVRQQSG